MLRTKSLIPQQTRQQEVIRMAALLGKVVTRHLRSRKRSLEWAKRVKKVKKGISFNMKNWSIKAQWNPSKVKIQK